MNGAQRRALDSRHGGTRFFSYCFPQVDGEPERQAGSFVGLWLCFGFRRFTFLGYHLCDFPILAIAVLRVSGTLNSPSNKVRCTSHKSINNGGDKSPDYRSLLSPTAARNAALKIERENTAIPASSGGALDEERASRPSDRRRKSQYTPEFPSKRLRSGDLSSAAFPI
jgi:hypothetical protein